MDAYITALAPLVTPQPLLTMPAFATTGWFTQTKRYSDGTKVEVDLRHAAQLSVQRLRQSHHRLDLPEASDCWTDKGTSNIETTYAPLISATNALGLGLRMAEFNSIACGGAAGVSDTFAQRFGRSTCCFRFAESGRLRRQLSHLGGSTLRSGYTNDVPDVSPLYYGMLKVFLASAR